MCKGDPIVTAIEMPRIVRQGLYGPAKKIERWRVLRRCYALFLGAV